MFVYYFQFQWYTRFKLSCRETRIQTSDIETKRQQQSKSIFFSFFYEMGNLKYFFFSLFGLVI